MITTDDYNFFDVMHLVLPTTLPPHEFYERFSRLYRLSEIRAQFNLRAAWQLLRMAVRGQGFVMRRVYGAVRQMRDAKAYLHYPGTTAKPDFVPTGFGSTGWVEKSGSPLVARAVQKPKVRAVSA